MLFTAAINARLASHLEGVNILGEEQAGWREAYSTLVHIYIYIYCAARWLNCICIAIGFIVHS